MYPNLIKENQRMSACKRLDLQTLGSQLVMMPKNLGLGRPAPTLVPCWSLNPCLQGTCVDVGLPQPKISPTTGFVTAKVNVQNGVEC